LLWLWRIVIVVVENVVNPDSSSISLDLRSTRPRPNPGASWIHITCSSEVLLLEALFFSSSRLGLVLGVVKTFVYLLDGHSSAALTILLLVVWYILGWGYTRVT